MTPGGSARAPRADGERGADGEQGVGLEATLVAALVALVLFAFLGVSVSLAPAGGFDTTTRTALLALDGGPAASLFTILNAVGSLEGGAILTIGLAGLFLGLRRPGAAGLLLSTWAAEGASSLVKEFLMRPRPPGAVVESALGESWSYPSGHVVRAVAVAGVLVWAALTWRRSSAHAPWGERAAFALAAGLVAGIVMGLARVATGAHWPTDVIGGLLLGGAYVLGLIGVLGLIERSRAGAPRPPPSPEPGSGAP